MLMRSGKIMASERPNFCAPCLSRGKSTTSVKYCTICQEMLCKDCVDYHKAFRVTRNHHLATTTTNDFRDDENILICSQHSEKRTEFYCDEHKTLLCSDCLLLTINHKTCPRVFKIENAGKHLCTEKITENMKDSSNQLVKSVQSAIEEIQKGHKCTSKSLQDLRCEIETIRSKMMEAFDRQTDHIVKEISKEILQNRGKCDEAVQSLTKLSERVNDNMTLLQTALNNGDYGSVFRSAVYVDKQFEHYRQVVERTNENCSKLKVTFEKSDPVKRLLADKSPLLFCDLEKAKVVIPDVSSDNFKRIFKKSTASVPTDIAANKHDTYQGLKDTKEHKQKKRVIDANSIHTLTTSSDDADEMPEVSTDSSHREIPRSQFDVDLSYCNSFDVNISDDKQPLYTGIVCLPDGSLVISDCKRCRLIMTKNNIFITDKRIEFTPGNLALFDQFLLVCLMKTNRLLLMKTSGQYLKEHRYLMTKFHPKFVQAIDDKRILVSSKDVRDAWCLQVMTFSGSNWRGEEINVDIRGYLEGSRIAVQHCQAFKSNYKIIQYSESSKSMKCLSENGREEWLIDDVDETTSVVTDHLGHIYVIKFSGEVQVFNLDGNFITSIFTKAMRHLKFAAFNKDMDKLYLTTFKDSTIHVINVRRHILCKNSSV